MSKTESPLIGMIVGLLLPIVCLFAFLITVAVIKDFDSLSACIRHFNSFGILYKIASLCLLPNAGLFLWWTRRGSINKARGVLSSCLLHGVFIIIVYFL